MTEIETALLKTIIDMQNTQLDIQRQIETFQIELKATQKQLQLIQEKHLIEQNNVLNQWRSQG
jgi:hypothetical protein